MPTLLQDKNREYKRYRHTPREKVQLEQAGFQHVLSSNVSAIAKDDDNLYVRFHGGATYRYRNKADLYEKMLQANSKGHFVWVELIRKRVPYAKVGSVPLQSDAQFTDRDLMEASQQQTALAGLITPAVLEELGIIVTDVTRLINGNVA